MPTRQPSSPPSSEIWLNAESADAASEAQMSSIPDDSLIGATLRDTYTVDRVLGEGGMGRIYEAHHTRITEKLFAIKVLRPELVGNPRIRARFEREAQAVARVTHPGVLAIVDVGTTPLGWPYMVCEHLNGLDLHAYLRRFKALPNDRVVHMGCRIAEALEAAHAQGVIHRDVKPSNVFLLGAFEPLGPEWDRVKLIDFGLSRFVSRDDQLTESGMVMGTPAYMSPEQARGGRTDHLTDVYGVGTVLYTAATGVPPFREESAQQTLIAVMSRDPVRPRERNASISEGLEIVIQRAMAKQPEARYPSMSALVLALANLELEARSQASGARPRAHDGGIRGVRFRFVALAIGAVLLAIGAVMSALAGAATLAGSDLQLTTRERIPLAVALCTAILLFWLGLRRALRQVWANTALLSDWLPRLRTPLFFAVVVYGLASFAVRFGSDVLAPVVLGGALGRSPQLAWPGWSVVLPALGLAAGAVLALHRSWWQPMRPRERWVWPPVLALGMVAAVLAFARYGQLARSTSRLLLSRWADVAAVTSPAGTTSAAVPYSSLSALPQESDAVLDAGSRAVDGPVPVSVVDAASAVIAPISSSTGVEARTLAIRLDAPPTRAPVPPVQAPAPTLTAAVSLTSDDLKGAPVVSPDEPEALKARAIAQASRASELQPAIRTIEQLLARAPDKAGDPEVRRIVKRAAGSEGDASRAAFSMMSEAMGSKGPDLLYDLMLTRPALSERAKYRLSRFRVRELFSPELAIAYDLRFSPSCASRVGLLKRAREVGDQRSINALSALVGKIPNCGRRDTVPCQAICQKEIEPFSRAIDTIARRMRAGERAASAN